MAIELVPEVNYLGLTLDSKMTWKAQIEKVTTKATQRMGILKSTFTRLRDHNKLKTSRQLYTALIRPIMLYSSPPWATANQKLVNRIQVTQNKALRIMSGAPFYVRNDNDFKIEYIIDLLRKTSKKFYECCETSEYTNVRAIGNYPINCRYRFPPRKQILTS